MKQKKEVFPFLSFYRIFTNVFLHKMLKNAHIHHIQRIFLVFSILKQFMQKDTNKNMRKTEKSKNLFIFCFIYFHLYTVFFAFSALFIFRDSENFVAQSLEIKRENKEKKCFLLFLLFPFRYITFDIKKKKESLFSRKKNCMKIS